MLRIAEEGPPLPNSTSSSSLLAFPCLFLEVFLPFQPLPGFPAPSSTQPWALPSLPLGPTAQKHLDIGPWSTELIPFCCKTKSEHQFVWKTLQTQLSVAPLQPFHHSRAVQVFCSCPISALQSPQSISRRQNPAWHALKIRLNISAAPALSAEECIRNPGYSFY